jgi:hypothetical protein
VCLLSTRNRAFAKIIAQVIKLKAEHPEQQIQSIRMDNAAEFSSHAFNDYCMALGIQFSTRSHMSILKMGWQNLSARGSNSLQDH